MRNRAITILVIAVVCLIPTMSFADLAPYTQDYEGLDQQDPAALAADGWWVYANVFGPDWNGWYGYGPFPAPNGGPGFSGIDVGQGGPEQGEQQMVVYSDYNNGNQGDGSNAIIEANVFQEQMIGAADVGGTWRFEFDAKRGNIEGSSIAWAFFKTLDPAAGYALTNFITIDMTNIPDAWAGYSLSIEIGPDLEGQILQFGFLNYASNYEGSGIFYDNLNFDLAPLSAALDIRPGGCPNPINTRAPGVLSAALLGTAEFDVNNVDVASLQLEGVALARSSYDDVAAPFEGAACGCTEAGPDGLLDLTLKFDNQAIVAAIGTVAHGTYTLTLTGTLLDGTLFEGQDCILLVGPGRTAPDLEADASQPTTTVQDLQFNSSVGTDSVAPQSSSTRERTAGKPAGRRSN